MLALLQALHPQRFKTSHLFHDLLSGLLVALIALPLAMAFAIASGMQPIQGIYTAVIAGIVAAAFGGSLYQITGPTGAFIVILADIVAHHGPLGLQQATLMAGILLLLMGLFKMGRWIEHIPEAVTVGFTCGIALIIWFGQWPDFFGLPAPTGHSFYEKLKHLLASLPQLNRHTTLLSCVSLVFLIVLPRLHRLMPAALITLLLMSAANYLLHWSDVRTIGSSFGALPSQFPSFQPLPLTIQRCIELMPATLSIALLGAIESLLSAVVADRLAKQSSHHQNTTEHDSDQELVGQGLANIASPLFGGFAATGAIARTAANIRSGGQTPLAAIFHGIILMLIIKFFAPLSGSIPLYALAAILFMVCYHMGEWRRFWELFTQGNLNITLVLVITFLVTILMNLIAGVFAGVFLDWCLQRFNSKSSMPKQAT